jgi:hypothetical protein
MTFKFTDPTPLQTDFVKMISKEFDTVFSEQLECPADYDTPEVRSISFRVTDEYTAFLICKHFDSFEAHKARFSACDVSLDDDEF